MNKRISKPGVVIRTDTGTENPFLVNISTKKKEIGRIAIQDYIVIQKSTGKPVDHETILIKEIDSRPFTKLFTSSFLIGLSTAESKVLDYILVNLEYERDCIFLTPESQELSSSTFYKCIAKLSERDIIAKNKVVKHLYWINPNFFFKGNYLNLKPLVIDK